MVCVCGTGAWAHLGATSGVCGSPSVFRGACSSHCSNEGPRELQVEMLDTMSQSWRGVWAHLAPLKGLWPRRLRVWGREPHPQLVLTHQAALSLPFLGDQLPLGCEASWPYKAVCGHLLEKLQSPHPASPPPWEPELGQAPEDEVGEGACWSLGPVRGEGRAHQARAVLGSPCPSPSPQGCPVWGAEQGNGEDGGGGTGVDRCHRVRWIINTVAASSSRVTPRAPHRSRTRRPGP